MAKKKKDPSSLVKATDNGKHPGGRPPKYKATYPRQAEKLCKLGAIDAELADFFEVNELTINRWKKKYPEFCSALKSKEYSNDKVKESLYNRALGYSHPDTHISNFQGEITITPITKHYPPDTAAAFIWLKNRDPENWRDKQEVELSGETTQVNIYELPDNGRDPENDTETE